MERILKQTAHLESESTGILGPVKLLGISLILAALPLYAPPSAEASSLNFSKCEAQFSENIVEFPTADNSPNFVLGSNDFLQASDLILRKENGLSEEADNRQNLWGRLLRNPSKYRSSENAATDKLTVDNYRSSQRIKINSRYQKNFASNSPNDPYVLGISESGTTPPEMPVYHWNTSGLVGNFSYLKVSLPKNMDDPVDRMQILMSEFTRGYAKYPVVSLGSGGTSIAYLVCPECKAESLSHDRVLEKGTYALKVFRKPRVSLEVFERRILSNRILLGLLQELTTRFEYQGRRLVRPAIDRTSKSLLQNGAFLQEYISGPSAQKLADAYRRWMQFSNIEGKHFLIESGFDPESIRSMKELYNYLLLLEEFYRLNHATVIDFAKLNQLELPYNRGRFGALLPVGFDFNRGQNVIWSIHDQQWVIIDW